MIENVKKGMTIYYYHYIDSRIEKGIVKDPKLQVAYKYIKFISKVDWISSLDYNGNETGTGGGTSGARLDHSFTTFEEADKAQKAEQEAHIEKLKSEITDLISLLEFPLKHDIRDGEYCDYFAQGIYKEIVEGIKNGDYAYSSSSGVGK